METPSLNHKPRGLRVVMSKKALLERKMAQRIARWKAAGCYALPEEVRK